MKNGVLSDELLSVSFGGFLTKESVNENIIKAMSNEYGGILQLSSTSRGAGKHINK